MEKKVLKEKLHQIIMLAEECLGDLGDQKTIGRRGGKHKVHKASSHKSLSDYIIELRDGGFFRQPKTAREVHIKLQMTYPCDANRVAVALVRLSQKKRLRKTSKTQGDKRVTAYVW